MGLPASGSALAVLPPVPSSPVEVLPHALSSIRPPSPRAERRDSGRPAACTMSRYSWSSFGLVSSGARMFRWSRWSVIVTSVLVVHRVLHRVLRRCLGQQHRRSPVPLDRDLVTWTDRVMRLIGADALLPDDDPGAAVEGGNHLHLVPEIHPGVHHRARGVVGAVGRTGQDTESPG